MRYAHFAKFLVESGFVVCANDHVGHGESVSAAQDLGHMPARDGAEVLVRDVHALRGIMQARFGSEVPYVMFGHSMGSFITRKYISEHGEGPCGGGALRHGPAGGGALDGGQCFGQCSRASARERYKSGLLHSMADGAYSKAVKNSRTDFDWLSTDPAQVDAYINDSKCGQMFTVGGYATLTALTGEVVRAESASKVPKVLPLLFIAGGEDPVGDCGRGVRKAAEEYRNAGVQSVETKIYAGMRHEILNEPGRARVMADVEAWLAKQGNLICAFVLSGGNFHFAVQCAAVHAFGCDASMQVSISSERMCAVGALLLWHCSLANA